jgi:hypothetical protein
MPSSPVSADLLRKLCAAKLGGQFVELSGMEEIRMGEFTRLEEMLHIAPRDYAQSRS